jgi:hypothetical protein
MELHFRPINLNITASAVAWYAAIVSTFTAAVQLANYARDRVRVHVNFQRDMELVNDRAYEGMTVTFVNVVNSGRRRLTITNVGAVRLTGKSWVFTDARPPLPHVLEEGEQIQVIVDQDGLNFDEIQSFVAYDAQGRKFNKHYAPWYKRVRWYYQRKLQRN